MAAVVVLWVTLAGCGGSGPATSSGGAGRATSDRPPAVLAAFYPYYFLVQQIGGNHVSVANLTQPGVEPHDLELTPRLVGDVGTADLVVYQKGFQPAVDEAVEQNRPARVLEVGAVVRPRGDAATDATDGAPNAATDASDEAPNGATDATDEHPPEQAGGDPHVWLDPDRFSVVATAVGDALSGIDAAHTTDYRTRASSLTAKLEALDQDFAAGLRDCTSRVIVTSHEAFGYLAARYGLRQVSISGLAPDAEPSPARIRAVMAAVRTHRVTTVFFETLVSPKAAQTLAGDAGVSTAVLDPVEGLAAPASGDYFSVMRANLYALRKALSCA
jgi:zinc transport system substrate-binding protein